MPRHSTTPSSVTEDAITAPRRVRATGSRRARTVGALLPLLAVAGMGLTMANAAQAESSNLVLNAGFEQGLTGWHTSSGAALTQSGGGHSGVSAGLVTNRTSAATTVALNDTTNTVQKTTSGHIYEAAAWVRAVQPGVSVGLRMMEYAGSTFKGEAKGTAWLSDTGWHRVTTQYTATSAGATIDLNVLAWQLKAAGAVAVDDLTLVDKSVPSSTPTTTAPPPEPSPTTPDRVGWRLVWSDEFSSSTVNGSKWNVEDRSTYGEGNLELPCLMNRDENLFQSGGVLHLRAVREKSPIQCGSNDARFPSGRQYTSAHMTTKNKAGWTYGRFEMRAKLPTAKGISKGLWPAFWMRPVSGGLGELDIMEAIGSDSSGQEHNKVHHTLWYDYSGSHPRQAITATLPWQLADAYHTYAVEWEKGEIRWYVDDRLTSTRNLATTPWLNEVFSKPFYIRLNLAIGGSWAGAPVSSTVFPQDFSVDYVRVYQR